jgi:LEA14-like dessication related protein
MDYEPRYYKALAADYNKAKILEAKKKKKRLMIYVGTCLIIFLIIGIIINLYLEYSTAPSLGVSLKEVDSVKPISSHDYEILFTLTFINPTHSEIQVEKVSYNVYLEFEHIGSGEKKSFNIQPGKKDHTFSLQFNIMDLSKAIRNKFLNSYVTIRIEGIITVPVELFNLFKVSEITWNYEKLEDVGADNVIY